MDKQLYPKHVQEEIRVVEITNSKDTTLEILNFGASIFSLKFRGENNDFTNVVVSPKNPEDLLTAEYKKHNKGFGASVGRYAGRISEGSITLGNEKFGLFTKDGVHLHGGNFGFTYRLWDFKEVRKGENPFVILSYLSVDGEEGYPGNLQVEVKYTLTEEDEVLIEYSATTDKETVVNLTNHTYFNLSGFGSVSDHKLHINSDKIVETNQKLLPTGEFLKAEGSEKNFLSSQKRIGSLPLDDVFALKRERETEIKLASEASGISLEIQTNQPAVVVYAPKVLPTDWPYQTEISDEFPSVCLETQNFPDAPHQENFPSAKLLPGEKYYNFTRWKFQRN